MAEQIIIQADGDFQSLDRFFQSMKCRSLLLVCGASIRNLSINGYFGTLEERLNIRVTRFSGYGPNPKYKSVVDGVACFRKNGCDSIAAVGGGSAMDVAKCIKLFANLPSDKIYLEQSIVPSQIPFLAVPTTAGTGAEATQFAVIYYNGEKQSVSHPSAVPDGVLFAPEVLRSLPDYQKKSTLLDALCHGVESFWSVNSTPESRQYAAQAIGLLFANSQGYLAGNEETYMPMLHGANLAGRAINISRTTAGHAMCYKLTSLYGISHGHAAALCVRELFPYMLEHSLRDCVDPRGSQYLQTMFEKLAEAMGCETPQSAAEKFNDFVSDLGLPVPGIAEEDMVTLVHSVNVERLKNSPVLLRQEDINGLYRKIAEGRSTYES